MLYRVISNVFRTNTYILISRDEALIVDPGFDKYHTDLVSKIVDLLHDLRCSRAILYLTHGHLDHFCGDLILKNRLKLLGVESYIAIHEMDSYLLRDLREHIQIQRNVVPSYSLETFVTQPHSPDIELRNQDEVRVGSIVLRVLHCPGHTKGSTILYFRDFAFTGDVILDGGIGRVDLPHSSRSEMRISIYRALNVLSPDVEILPGHGEPFYLREQLNLIIALTSSL